MLLIFFLVTTSMGADKGIKRELPALNPKEQPASAVREGAIMKVSIRAKNQVICDGQTVAIGELTHTFKDFIEQKGLEHVFEISSDRDASYDTYYQVQNALQTAYRELRNERALNEYKRPYDDCTAPQKVSIDKAVPQRIAENYDTGKEDKQ